MMITSKPKTFLFGMVFCLIYSFSLHANARDLGSSSIEHIKELRKNKNTPLFQSTYWVPNAGVTLLNEKSARKSWDHFASKKSKCGIRDLAINIDKNKNMPIRSFFVFKTESMHIFLYEYYMSNTPGFHWRICNSSNTKVMFDSYDGIPAKLIHPMRIDSEFGGCPAPAAKVRFRRLSKGGPLFLEVHAQRCQTRENHYELMVDIHGETLRTVPGSTMAMDWRPIDPDLPWSWWYVGDRYRQKKIVWNDEMNTSWSRVLGRIPNKISDEQDQKNLPMVLVKEKCAYSSHDNKVVCQYDVIKKAKIEHLNPLLHLYSSTKNPDLDTVEDLLSDVPDLRKAGFVISEQEVSKLATKRNELISKDKY